MTQRGNSSLCSKPFHNSSGTPCCCAISAISAINRETPSDSVFIRNLSLTKRNCSASYIMGHGSYGCTQIKIKNPRESVGCSLSASSACIRVLTGLVQICSVVFAFAPINSDVYFHLVLLCVCRETPGGRRVTMSLRQTQDRPCYGARSAGEGGVLLFG